MTSGQLTSCKRSGIRHRFMDALMIPWVDKTIAVVAVLPWVHAVFRIIMRGEMSIPRASLAIQFLIVIITMVFRTTPVRITPNPWYWLLTFAASYQGFFFAAFARGGTAIAPTAVTSSIGLLALAIAIYARLSLGRSMGLVPAQRVIVTRGAYRFVRHPIYAGIFIGYTSFVLRMYSPLNLALSFIGCGLFVVKSIVEERFLSEDEEYANYLARVRWRWLPGIA